MSQTDTNQQDLSKLKLPELRKIASDMGLKSLTALRKGELITAITTGEVPRRGKKAAAAAAAPQTEDAPQAEDKPQDKDTKREDASSEDTRDSSGDSQEHHQSRSAARRARRIRARQQRREDENRHDDESREEDNHSRRDEDRRDEDRGEDGRSDDGRRYEKDRRDNNRDNDREDNRDNERRGRRGRRGRRNENNNQNNNQDQQPEELMEVAGILDVKDNNTAFVRTTGYRASNADVFVNNNLVKRFSLRSGDAITGKVRKSGGNNNHGHGKNRRKHNQLVHVDTVNGQHPEEAKKRPDFHKLTPLYPNKRLRLETEPHILTTRVIDLVMPIGKGQRALIVSPPKAGKTTILQNVANAITTNNPECYLMVVLVDERPEEVTDMERSVRGEVIASTFDRPPGEHTAVAELAIERAKRLVEMGQDVVVLLDSITRLGRAYNNSSPASGRILSGGVDSNALYPPKRFLGAARNIEQGGSLTIIATAMVETGSAGDTVIFEEFKGTGNAELKLDRKIAERRVFPAVDVNPSGTRKDELLMTTEEFRVMHKLRRILAGLDNQQAIDLLIKQIKKTKSNAEFLMQIASSAPMTANQDTEDYQ